MRCRSLVVEVSGWRDELRLRLLDGRRRRLPHVEVFRPSSGGGGVDDLRLPWTQPTSGFDDLSYLWIGRRTATEPVLKASHRHSTAHA